MADCVKCHCSLICDNFWSAFFCRVKPVLMIVLEIFGGVVFLVVFGFVCFLGVVVFCSVLVFLGVIVVSFFLASIVSMTSRMGPSFLFFLMSVSGIHLVGGLFCFVAVRILMMCFLSSLCRRTLARLPLISLICAGWSFRR